LREERFLESIAIDGPAGAGKSTAARLLAQKLGYLYIDTGAMYRALTWKALNGGISLQDSAALARLAGQTRLEFFSRAGDAGPGILVDGVDASRAIRTPQVARNVSLVAAIPGVRRELVEQQRRLAEKVPVVMDGRDIGTNVLPHSRHKFFLTASLEERARRRYYELLNQGYQVKESEILQEVAERDRLDRQRSTAPLLKAADAIEIDTTGLKPEKVVEELLKHL